MGPSGEPQRSHAEDGEPELRRLLAPGPPVGAAAAVDWLRAEAPAPAPPWRPRVMLNMVSTADGRATIDGRSGPISGPADRALFHGLRGTVDAVMAGAGTVRAERYGPIIADAEARRARVERGLSDEPLACIVSGRLALEPDIPLLADVHSHVVIVTSSSASLPAGAGPSAHVEYLRAEHEGQLDLPAAMHELRERFSVESLLCEGGPHLNSQLLRAGLVDELFLSLAPMLAGGDLSDGQAPLRILAGAPLEVPLELELIGVLESESTLFLRYGVRSASASSPARV
jgi:riboflavin-specific deaminase-like protein